MKCALHKPVVVSVYRGGTYVVTYCDQCKCRQHFWTQDRLRVGDRFRWRDVS